MLTPLTFRAKSPLPGILLTMPKDEDSQIVTFASDTANWLCDHEEMRHRDWGWRAYTDFFYDTTVGLVIGELDDNTVLVLWS
jgi:hypothetical protein